MNACTIIARNYLPAAIVLAESFQEFHPDGRFSVFLLDEGSHDLDDAGLPFTIIRPSQLPMEQAEFARMAMIYDVMELATAVKPWVLQYLLEQGAEEVLYFDPDIQIFAPLDDLGELARRHGIVLTPHTTAPIPRDGKRITEAEILYSGVYNLGFIGVGKQTGNFLSWWQERLRRDCIVDPTRMLFVDQRWIDFVPGYYDHAIAHDPGLNVAYWNLYAREMQWTGDGYAVNGQPLRFFHFSGYQPDVPYILSKHQGENPRVLLSEHPDVARACRAYGERLLAAGYGERDEVPYPFGRLPNGVPIDRRMRRLYRAALIEAEENGTALPANPLEPHDADRFVNWLNEPSPQAQNPRITRYLHALWSERLDLQQVFSPSLDPTGVEFLRWVVHTGQRENAIPDRLMPRGGAARPVSTQAPSGPPTPGLNVAGYFRAELGVGEAGRLLLSAVRASGTPYATLTYTHTMSRQEHPFQEMGGAQTLYDTNLICVNADQTPGFAQGAGRDLFDGRYSIGFWFWETEDFPPAMATGLEYVDEIWVASEHVRHAVQRTTSKPVLTVPLPVTAPSYSASLSREDLDLPSGFVFLFSFDFLSVFNRKNPLGLIEAFKRAFPAESEVSLIIKTINGDKRLVDLERLRIGAAGHPGVHVIDRYLPVGHVAAMTALADCYVSLHRAEGFGLTIAEAMALGKPVIATNYSGNTDFMSPANSYPVPYTLEFVGEGNEPYLATGRWAEPDLDAAADLMREVVENPENAQAKGDQAKRDMEALRSPEVGGRWIEERVAVIRRTPRVSAVTVGSEMLASASTPLTAAATPSAHSPDALAAQYFAKGPDIETPTRRGGPWGRSVRLARRAVFRLLRNYHDEQRYAGMLTVHALHDLETRTQEALSSISAEIAGTSSANGSPRDVEHTRTVESVGSIETETLPRAVSTSTEDGSFASSDIQRRLVQAETQLADIQQRLEEHIAFAEQHFGGIDRHLADVSPHLQDLDTRVTDIGNHLVGADERISGLNQTIDQTIATGIPELSQRVNLLSSRLREIIEQMDALPYMNAPSALLTAGADGRPVLGYRRGGHHRGGSDVDGYLGFENMFRGDEAFIRNRQRRYVDQLLGHAPVLDLGCGRGEMLELLAEAGIQASGVDSDPAMVEHCRAKGLDVQQGNAIDVLRTRAPESLGAVFGAQLIEHLRYEDLLTLLQSAKTALRPDGVLILETVNPHSFPAMKTFWVDLTHQKPIFPEVLLALCQLQGYGEATVLFPNGVGELQIDRRTQGEYAVIATPGTGAQAVHSSAPSAAHE